MRVASAGYLNGAKRIVIKIGSILLVDPATGAVHDAWLRNFLSDVAHWSRQGHEIILVSSGSVALGRQAIPKTALKESLVTKQAAAAVGQIYLVNAYHRLLAEHQITVAQILLTLSDSENRTRYLNARNTLENILAMGAIPIVNENDTVATSEIRFGDNDRLAARVAQMVSADVLLLLSDIDGLYEQDPRKNLNAKFIEAVTHITDEVKAMATGSLTQIGSGGMTTKLQAAEIAYGAGCKMVIMDGKAHAPLKRLLEGERCTWFLPPNSPKSARKHWLAHRLAIQARVTVDAGAVNALSQGKSLLAVGIQSIDGDFVKGDLVEIIDEHGTLIAKGLCQYPSADAKRILGVSSEKILNILGYYAGAEFIHRDNLVVVA